MRTLHCSLFAFLVGAAMMVGCSSGSSPAVPHGNPTPNAGPTKCPAANYSCIQHVVIIIQENRTFNNLFMGYPGAETRSTGRAGSRIVKLRKRGLEQSIADISHCWDSAMTAWDHGKMDGFYLVYPEKWPLTNCPSLARPAIGVSGIHSPYVYVPNDAPNYVQEAGPYWQMAMQYVIADHYFPTDFGPSFTAHQYLV